MTLSLASSAVVLTTGSRPVELAAALQSLENSGLSDRVIVWNSPSPPEQIALDCLTVSAGQNLGIPGGRNFGVEHSTGDIVVFLDDDAEVLTTDLENQIQNFFAKNPRCGALGFRIVDESGATMRRHNPRFGNRGVATPGAVATFLGGACAIRRTAFDEVGRYDDTFFYSMEEQDLAWRFYAAGYFVYYQPNIVVRHPATLTTRHPEAVQRTWQNRVSAAIKSLPYLVLPFYLTAHGIRGLRNGLSLSWAIAQVAQGLRERNEARNSMSWATVIQLTKIGRPPIF